jgi:hypothetical protein
MVSVARATHLHSIVLIHGAADWAELLNQQLQKYSQQHADSFCLAGIYALHRKNTKEPIGTISSSKLMVTDDIIRTLKPGTMAVLLLEDPEEMRAFMEVCQYISGLVFLTVFHPWNTNSYAGKYICTTLLMFFLPSSGINILCLYHKLHAFFTSCYPIYFYFKTKCIFINQNGMACIKLHFI